MPVYAVYVDNVDASWCNIRNIGPIGRYWLSCFAMFCVFCVVCLWQGDLYDRQSDLRGETAVSFLRCAHTNMKHMKQHKLMKQCEKCENEVIRCLGCQGNVPRWFQTHPSIPKHANLLKLHILTHTRHTNITNNHKYIEYMRISPRWVNCWGLKYFLDFLGFSGIFQLFQPWFWNKYPQRLPRLDSRPPHPYSED